MPYVLPGVREDYSEGLELLPPTTDPGDLNYLITTLCVRHLKKIGIKYDTLNEVIGVLECAKQEFYRRMVAGYEEVRRLKNGDVY
jgi:hypothetical protein